MKETDGQGDTLRRDLTCRGENATTGAADPAEKEGRSAPQGRREDGDSPRRGDREVQSALHTGGVHGATDLEDVVGGPVHAAVLDPHGQLVGGLAGQEVLADQRLGELGPFEVLQSQNQQTEKGGDTRTTSLRGSVFPRASPDPPPLYPTALHLTHDTLMATQQEV